MIFFKNKRLLLSLLTAVVLLIAAQILYTHETRSTAMKCFKLEDKELRERLVTLKETLISLPATAVPKTVRIRFDGDLDRMRGGVFTIESNRMDKTIYLAPFADEITLSVDSELGLDGGYDILSFKLFRLDTGEVCLWSGDLGFPFWGDSKAMTVKLLNERIINQDDIVQTYEVDFDK